MARSAKTNHVMSLVGEKSKTDSADKAAGEKKAYPKTPPKASNPAIVQMEEEQRSVHYNTLSADSLPIQKNTEIKKGEDPKKTALPKQPDSKFGSNSDSINEKSNPGEELKTDQSNQTLYREHSFRTESIGLPEEDFQKTENQKKSVKQGITAVVPDLVNQELGAIVRRFNISPTDSNLWQLTKSALETIRPEFSLNAYEYEEKCSKLRQRVILEMTKAAIKLSKNQKNNSEK